MILTYLHIRKILHSKNYLSKRIKNNEIITLDYLYNYNMMGLSNTAAKAKIFNFNLNHVITLLKLMIGSCGLKP